MITLGLVPDWQFSSDPAVNPYAGPPAVPSMGLAGFIDSITSTYQAGSWLSTNRNKLMIGAGVLTGLVVASRFIK